MVETKDVQNGSVVVLLSVFLSLAASAGIDVTTDTFSPDVSSYGCMTKPEKGIVQCDDFSKYVHAQGKCIRNDDTNLICRSGWVLIENDTMIPDEEYPEETPVNSPTGQAYICPPNGAECYEVN